ncbi:unnamed protein product [Somion occarium]|uniref:DUF7918 domain-containing protein n=1 Tax=Somion occarium TaxID=3059160 RepID=A0ABP1CZY4_9APHY
MKLSGIEVYIKTRMGDPERIKEFQVKTDVATKTATCFIPSKEGQVSSVALRCAHMRLANILSFLCISKEFEICWKSELANNLSFRSYIDGRAMGRSSCCPFRHGSRWGIRSSPTTRLPFKFANVVLSDDDSLMTDGSGLQNIGTIVVEVGRIIHAEGKLGTNFVLPGEIGPVHEKTKKAGSHCVMFGETVPCPNHARTSSRPLNPGEGIWAKFIFQYRPRGSGYY